MKNMTHYILLTVMLLLVACTSSVPSTSNEAGSDVMQTSAENVNAELDQTLVQEDVVDALPDPFMQARIIADILFAAKNAFDDEQLMLPAGDNAYERYLQVLELDPGNSVALEGIQEIVEHYIGVADEFMEIGQYDNAQQWLDRAASIDTGNEDVLTAYQRLEEARLIKVDYFSLDPVELNQQGAEIMSHLSEIGEFIKNSEATFLITARTDDEGRWIYKIMREAVGGYRLRGNIELGSRPGIRVDVPQA
ncbi:hypothetical protein OAP18_03080 [Gammaproteobacteria bacterium]|nr:hypothetical protein [Gammaproteobacteria bacterium]